MSMPPETAKVFNDRVINAIRRLRKTLTERLVRALSLGDPDLANMSPIDLMLQQEIFNTKLNHLTAIMIARGVTTEEIIAEEFTAAAEEAAEINEERFKKMPSLLMAKKT